MKLVMGMHTCHCRFALPLAAASFSPHTVHDCSAKSIREQDATRPVWYGYSVMSWPKPHPTAATSDVYFPMYVVLPGALWHIVHIGSPLGCVPVLHLPGTGV